MSKPTRSKVFNKINEKELKNYAAFFEEHGLETFELEENGIRIKLERAKMPQPQVIERAEVADVSPPAYPLKEVKVEETSVVDPEITSNLKEIKSPIVGTFYASPSPEADPFVSVGKQIGPNDVVGIVEAMKVMNEIKAGLSGKVVEILVENGDVLTAEQVIMRLE